MPGPVPPVEIRPATEADGAAVTALLVAQLREHGIATPEAGVEHAVAGVLRHPRRGHLLVAVAAGRLVGVAALTFMWAFEHGGRSAWLEELYVEPSRRNQGIGSALLRTACDLVARGGAAAIDLEVEARHERAARLYARNGFRPLDRARWVRASDPPAPPRAAAPPLPLTGGCFCGAVRYRVSAPPVDVAHCHCGICRRTTGAPFVTWATFPAAAFEMTNGTPQQLRATPRAVRTLCPTCGTALTFREPKRPNSVDVTVGSLDTPDLVPPANHIRTSSRLPWVHLDDDLPQHREENPAERDIE